MPTTRRTQSTQTTLLSAQQRAVVRVSTGVDPLIVDRCTEAFDALIRGDVEGYRQLMGTAVAQLGYEGQIPEADRPTAVDVVKSVLIVAYADRLGVSHREARDRLVKLQQGG